MELFSSGVSGSPGSGTKTSLTVKTNLSINTLAYMLNKLLGKAYKVSKAYSIPKKFCLYQLGHVCNFYQFMHNHAIDNVLSSS